MAITFENTPLRWDNVGVEPSESLKTSGWLPGARPSAQTFNYQINNASECITEIQEKVSEHTHSTSEITGTLPVSKGGTGETTVTAARTALGIIGEKREGETVILPDQSSVTVGTCAEIFNDYRERTYDNGSSYPNQGNIASGSYSHAEGSRTTASGNYSHVEGYRSISTGDQSHAEGYNTQAQGDRSHAEGANTLASGPCSHAEGYDTRANGDYSHAEGYNTSANGHYSHAEGYKTVASIGYCHAGGYETIANQFVLAHGRYNVANAGPESVTDMNGNLFIIGNGTSNTSRGNAFRVTTAGKAYGLQNFSSSGADYAEYFEWIDGNTNNEDRRGYFVTLDGEKIRKATENDSYILGVISSTPCVIGDSQSEMWQGTYKKDIFGKKITEVIQVPEKIDENTGEVIPPYTETRWELNPEYNPNEDYISREYRKEWAIVGLIGKLVVIDDGTCKVNGYCKPNENGIATMSDSGYRVMKRLDSNHIQILLK